MAKRMTNQEALDRIKDLFKKDRWEFINQIDKDAIKIAYKALQREVDEENANNKFFDEIIEKMEKQMANENKTQGE